jgi:pimeloyl-ACP methyl ester carboxylesterase
MARFVLVHGAFAGAWIWGPLIDRMKATGHAAEAFDLPGLGDDRTPLREVTLDTYAARLCELLAAKPEPAIIVGSSMGGIVATQGAARSPGRVVALVYVAAFLPKDGQSLLDLTKLPEGADDQVQANITVEGDPPVANLSAADSLHAFYECSTPDVATWAVGRQRAQPVAPFVTPVSIPPGVLDGIKRYYVVCKRDRAIPPALQRRMIAENGCDGVVEFDTDHIPQLSKTAELAEALDRFATHAAAALEGDRRG